MLLVSSCDGCHIRRGSACRRRLLQLVGQDESAPHPWKREIVSLVSAPAGPPWALRVAGERSGEVVRSGPSGLSERFTASADPGPAHPGPATSLDSSVSRGDGVGGGDGCEPAGWRLRSRADRPLGVSGVFAGRRSASFSGSREWAAAGGVALISVESWRRLAVGGQRLQSVERAQDRSGPGPVGG